MPLRSRSTDQPDVSITQTSRRVEFGRPPLHPLEEVLVGVTIVHLCFLPWALGTMHGWSQLTSLGLAAFGFILATFPRRQPTDANDVAEVRHWPMARVAHSSVFWVSVVFLLYIAVQGLNPSWHFFANAESWWLEPVASVSWLPSSVDAPFVRSNSWRVLAVFTSLVLLVASIRGGFTRRKSYHTLFSMIAANGGVLAMLGFAQRLADADRIFGSYKPNNRAFVSSFIYPNHAGCYFNLMVGLAVGVAWWHHQRSNRKVEGPGPAMAATAFAICCGGLVIISYSRMAITLLMTFTIIIGVTLLFRLYRRRGPLRRRQEAIPLILVFLVFLGIGLTSLGSDKIRERFETVASSPFAIMQDRSLARKAATDMFRDRWFFGWGAGSFRYTFSKYSAHYPSIFYTDYGAQRIWEHPHNDPLEFLCEFGVVGILPLLYLLIQMVRGILRHRVWRNTMTLPLICTVALVPLHSWFDFVFQCPAILLTWAALLTSAIRWTELDHPGGRPTTITAN